MATKLPTRPIGQKGDQRLPRTESRDHLAFVRSLPCLICHSVDGIEAAHVRYHSLIHGKDLTGAGRKPDDRWAVPLCAEHHRTGPDAQHNTGERLWWIRHEIDPLTIAALIYSHSTVGDEDAATYVALSAARITRGQTPGR